MLVAALGPNIFKNFTLEWFKLFIFCLVLKIFELLEFLRSEYH